ncbi:MFS transporter [Salisediminibacterium selenitireducens]|uniref:Major facilitator superfamily MFS_1 n=1 Tax=Bacillus selenitireducens (strain ATCC 700615 / DSM 15326 / MLS10) TaxID=439292 RepID=D6XXS1_BACIE|nr:MFS transporter [Salisediminibacterium selenitireducens]ADI00114.1 major facilitator superfamily MFS_1 [[Bacillus] selenitireducens MLS10]
MDQSLIKAYQASSEKQERLYKKTLAIVGLSQLFGGLGLAAGITVGALLAQEMLGSDGIAGLPTALFTLGSALAALMVGRFSQRFGRRLGLTFGFLAGGIGAYGVVLAAVMDNVPLLFIALFIYGSGTATNLQARYAGTDLAKSHQRAKAVSIALVVTTFGAVAGPNLVSVMGDVALNLSLPSLSGPFLLAGTAYLTAGVLLFLFLRPDPFLLATALAKAKADQDREAGIEATEARSADRKGILAGGSLMVLSQFVMVAIMTMTPIHMGHHDHSLQAIGIVIGVHVGAMFLPSLVTGYLVDKVGRKIMAQASAVTLLMSGVGAAMAPPESMAAILIALLLLGLGWNFGLISGTAILVDATPPLTRAKTQGSADVWIALAGALGGGLSGVIVMYGSFAALSLFGGVVSLLMIPIIQWMYAPVKGVAKA